MSDVLKKVFGSLIAFFLVALVFMVTLSFYRDVSFGANIEEYTLLSDETALIKLSAGANSDNITSVVFVFNDSQGKSYYYETSAGAQNLSVPYTTFLFWKSLKGGYVYPINASDVGLSSFRDVTSVEVIFKYESSKDNKKISQTKVLDVKQITDEILSGVSSGKGSGGGSSGGGSSGSGSSVVPPVIESNDTDDDLGNETSGVGNETNVSICSPRTSCGGECGTVNNSCGGWLYCGECLVPCEVGNNCFYVSVNGSGNRSGALGSEMNLTWAKLIARPGYTFMLRGGNYGSVSFGQAYNFYGTDRYGTNWSMPITYKVVLGEKAIFSGLSIRAHGDEPNKNRYLVLDGLTISPGGVTVTSVSNLRLRNLNLSGIWAPYADGLVDYGINLREAGSLTDDVVIENSEIAYYQDGIAFGGGSGIVVRNNNIHNLSSTAISCSGASRSDFALIENNVIHDQKQLSESATNSLSTHGSGLTLRCNNLIIRNNTIYDYGNTRPMRWYQGATSGIPVLGVNGYQNVLLEGNLVYMTPGAPYNGYVEIIDMGKNFTIRNNTFTGGLHIFLVKDYNGSELNIYNNLLSSMGISNDYYSNLDAQTCSQARINWDNVHERKNVYPNSLTTSGDGYLCWYDQFNSGSNSFIFDNVHNSRTSDLEPSRIFFENLFSNYSGFDFHPKINNIVCNGTLWNTPVGIPAAGALSCK